MSSTRPRAARRTVAQDAPPTPSLASSPRARRSTGRRAKPEPEPSPELDQEEDGSDQDAEGEDDDAEGEDVDADGEEPEDHEEDDPLPVAGPSRRGNKGRARASAGTDGDVDAEEEEERIKAAKSLRTRKSVSYREMPVEVEEEEDAEGEEDEDEDMDGGSELTPAPAEVTTPKRRGRQSKAKEEEDPSFKREKIGTGRGGFSIKGAAAAAARARWDKVRREKAERGEESDGGEKRKSRSSARKKAPAADVTQESVAMDSTVTIKGKEYTVGDDELVLPDDPKGDTKVDAEGRLLGGREYKLVTFTSPTRRNPNRVYALTIDAARACGYTDSLAFLRRCPQVLKLGCNPDERQMLIDIGRVTGNLKHRMVTMVAVRNVFKLMGARVIKGGKWVTDDYYEDESLVKCAENGFTPYTQAVDDDIIANAISQMQPQGRPPAHDREPAKSSFSLAPFYTLGGPTTHFAGNGADPWSEAGWGNKRAKLRGQGVSEEDWMLRTAEETRKVDGQLREYREERLQVLEGADARVWVWAQEERTEEGDKEVQMNGNADGAGMDAEGEAETPDGGMVDEEENDGDGALRPRQRMERKRSALSQEVTFKPEDKEMANGEAEAEGPEVDEPDHDQDEEIQDDGFEKTEGGKIVVQTVEEEEAADARWNWGLGSWERGTVRAAYEPHTHMPHVPLSTQPNSAFPIRLSPNPILTSQSDEKHKNFVQSTITGQAARGLASVEYVFEDEHRHQHQHQQLADEPYAAEPGAGVGLNLLLGFGGKAPGEGERERKRRWKEVEDAVSWEKEARRKRAAVKAAAA
ncbi:hypothetical protein EHS25_003196 [Saitozyma podzolica]|uniref:Chromatin structure-remodeling complex protein RSC7 n=1 Tax=Saitozyma podzolica TaxID=1890683 RepID=A0A427Y8B8_9TREE|nr:hypothetical protein EHS25_003196 [Saitozyma podzolica]